MFTERDKEKIKKDERLHVDIYEKLEDFLEMDEGELRAIVDLVNDTNDISQILYSEQGRIIQERLKFDREQYPREEVETLVNTYRDFYRTTAEQQIAMALSDTEYEYMAYQMDVCFLEWLLEAALHDLKD